MDASTRQRAVNTAPSVILRVASYGADDRLAGTLKAGASVKLTVALHGAWGDNANVAGTLSTTDAAVSVTKATSVWGPILSGQTVENRLLIHSAFPSRPGTYGRVVTFTLATIADGVASTVTFTATTESAVVTVGGTLTGDTLWTNDRGLFRPTM